MDTQNQIIEDNKNFPEKNDIQEKSKTKSFFLMMLLATFFVSAVSGAIFGYIFSHLDSGVMANIFRNKNQKSLLSNKAGGDSEIVRQKITQEDSAIIDVVKNSTPSVVSIVVSKDVPKIKYFGGMPNFFGDPFNFNFNQGTDPSQGGTEKQTIGGGTGFFISADGMIVTNRHVVDDDKAEYTVVTDDDKEHTAKVLALDPVNDIAVIKIEGDNYPTLSIGDSDSIQIGQTAIAIGNSLGEFSNTVSRGIISGLKRNLTAGDGMGQAEKLNNIIQTDAAINPGNSGGPLLDITGQVIGINVAIAQGAQNVGFAIPANTVIKIVNQVKKTGKISTPFIGLRYMPIDDDLQKANSLPYNYGALIARGEKITDLAVIPGSPADKAGIIENDIVLEVDGKKVDSKNDLVSLISQYNVGDKVDLKIWHKGKEKNISITLEERK